MNPLTQFKITTTPTLLIPLLVTCFALSQQAQAVGPDTDGAIPGSNNGEGIGVLDSLTGGIWNTGTGFEALSQFTGGNQNTATGLRALFSDTNGGFNTATGVYALYSNTSGFYNSAAGAYSLANNTDGNYNTANGYGALNSNTASYNTAVGFGALFKNTTGNVNTANGVFALYSNTTGGSNTANGISALYNNTDGINNTAIGSQALFHNTTGSENTALGRLAGVSQTTGSGNVYIGHGVGAVGGESNHTYIKNIKDTSVSGGGTDTVTVNLTTGLLGHATSARRYKEDIKPMDKASEALYRLNPVTYRYKKEIDATQRPAFGLIAEEVAEVNPDLVAHNVKEQPESVHYEMVNAMLLNEFLKEHKRVEEQQATIAQLKSTVAQQQRDFQATVAQQQKQIEALTAGLQKVSAQVEMSRPAPQTVLNNQ